MSIGDDPTAKPVLAPETAESLRSQREKGIAKEKGSLEVPQNSSFFGPLALTSFMGALLHARQCTLTSGP